MPPLMNYNQYESTYTNMSIFTEDLSQISLKHPLLTPPDAFVQPNKRRRMNNFPVSPTKKSVKFAVSSVAYRSNRTQEDIVSSWYSKEEMIAFRNELSEFVRALRRANWNVHAVDAHQHCKRGFEAFFSRSINKDVQTRRALVTKNVLKEQQQQKLLNTCNVESIRAVSVFVSRCAQDKALELGVQDSDELLMDALLKMPLSLDYGEDLHQPHSFVAQALQPISCQC